MKEKHKLVKLYQVIITALLLIFPCSDLHCQIPSFTRIDTGALVDEVIRGRGLYVVDYNLDGLLDLYIGNSTGIVNEVHGSGRHRKNLLYSNQGGGIFIKDTCSGLSDVVYEHNSGSTFGDIDNDGDPDLYNYGKLYLNNGKGKYHLAQEVTDRLEIGTVWLDINNDALLNVITGAFFDGNYAFINNGDGTLSEGDAGDFSTWGVGGSQTFSMADVDDDGDMDILEANFCYFGSCDPIVPNFFYINDGDGTFSAMDTNNVLLKGTEYSLGSSWGDFDNDGDMDAYLLSVPGKKDVLFRNEGNLEFSRIVIEPEEAINKFSYNSSWGDVNNDGYLDLFVSVAPEGSLLFRDCSWFENILFMNKGDGTFERLNQGSVITDGGEPHVMNDFDNDGDLDIIIGHGNTAPQCLVYIYINNGNNNNWLNISCEGTLSNRSAIGTRVRVNAVIDGKSVWMTREISQENGIHACNGPRLHFGIGNAEKAEEVIIRWPNGDIETLKDIPANKFYKAVEGVSFDPDPRIEQSTLLTLPYFIYPETGI